MRNCYFLNIILLNWLLFILRLNNIDVIIISVGLWKKSRKELQPFFVKNGAMFGCIPEMNKLIYKCVAEMKKHANGEEFDLWNFLPDLSFNIICSEYFPNLNKYVSANLFT